MKEDRFDRNIRFFGRKGQEELRKTNVAVVGVGGLGSHVVQQLAYLGIGGMSLIDSQTLKRSSLNRYVTARHDDLEGEPLKVDLAERLILAIDPSIHVNRVPESLVSEQAFELVRKADYVVGCLDSEGGRLILTELCAAYCCPYYDLASDIIPDKPQPSFGGRILVSDSRKGCLVCFGILDMDEAQQELESPDFRGNREAVYGVGSDSLSVSGPSVVSSNGVVASLAVTELMVEVTGVRSSKKLLYYHGHLGKVTVPTDEPEPECFYCKSVWGSGDAADLHRYIREGVGDYLR